MCRRPDKVDRRDLPMLGPVSKHPGGKGRVVHTSMHQLILLVSSSFLDLSNSAYFATFNFFSSFKQLKIKKYEITNILRIIVPSPARTDSAQGIM